MAINIAIHRIIKLFSIIIGFSLIGGGDLCGSKLSGNKFVNSNINNSSFFTLSNPYPLNLKLTSSNLDTLPHQIDTLTKIIAIEYFINTDPGFGNGIPVPILSDFDIVNLPIDIDISAINNGIHRMVVRSKDELGNWSISNEYSFIKATLPILSDSLPDIIAAEYFIGIDPGVGNGQAVPLTPSKDISNLAFSIDISNQSPGLKRLVVRILDDLGRWSLSNEWLLVIENLPVLSDTIPDIIAAEYFIGIDPGLENGQAIPLTPSKDISNLAFSIDISNQSPGLKRLVVRTLDDLGRWSLSNEWLLVIENLPVLSDSIPDIIAAEYFVGIDPGFGNGHAIPITPSKDISNLAFSIDLSNQSPGLKRLVVRTLDDLDRWSLSNEWFLVIENLPVLSDTIPDIIAAEYFIGIDPGFGNGQTIPLTPSKDISNIAISIDISNQSPGLKRMAVRTLDDLGKWSLSNEWLLIIDNLPVLTDSIPDIIAAEYFIGIDPGFGNGQAIPLTPSKDISNIAFSIDISNQSPGLKRLVVRTLDDLGKWSLSNEWLLIIDNLPVLTDSIPDIVAIEYFIGEDPGFGNGTPISITPSKDISNIAFEIDISNQNSGINRFVVRSIDALGMWSISSEWLLVIDKLPMLSDNIPNLASIEFFIDTLGGFGEGTSIPLPFVENTQNLLIGIDAYSLLSGIHEVYIRSKDIDGNWSFLQMDTFVYYYHDLGIDSLISPKSGCELSNSESITIGIKNIGGLPETGFDLGYSINGGPVFIENVGSLQIPLGFNTTEFTFSNTIDLSNYGDHIIKIFPILPNDRYSSNDTLILTVSNFPPLLPVSNMFPLDGASEISLPTIFSWQSAPNASYYDLYIWHDTTSIPLFPTVSGISQITYFFNGTSLEYGETYKWQVFSKTDYCETPGPIQTFTLKELPDLRVQNVQTPVSPFSGQEVSISWTIENQGQGQTGMNVWTDAVYLSNDTILNYGNDIYLGAFPNLTALSPSQSYAQSVTVTLPQNSIGYYYLFVVTNRFNGVLETYQNNNDGFNAINIMLTPPPDLQVTSILTPGNSFSGQVINVNWTVSNLGSGPTITENWLDRIYIDTNQVFDPASAILLGDSYHSGLELLEDSSYTKNLDISLPINVFGNYFVHVETDVLNEVYENAFESNNISSSNTLSITLTPPPDLIITTAILPDTVNNNDLVNIEWTVKNQGASSTPSNWNDHVFISSDSFFNVNNSIFLASYNNNLSLDLNEEYTTQLSLSIPSNIAGKYYFYILTDYHDQVFEYLNESNNFLKSDTLCIFSADLVISETTSPDTVYSGTTETLQWISKNIGLGNINSISRIDEIFLSTYSLYHPDSVISIGTINYGNSQSPGEEINKQLNVNFPEGIEGTYYLYFYNDYGDSVFEDMGENNNLSIDTILVILSPPPDLQVSQIDLLPDSTIAGTTLPLSYTLINSGSGNISPSSRVDRIYISASPIWIPSHAVPLKDLQITGAIANGSSYTGTTSFILPMLGGAANNGICYIYVYADVNNDIYEHLNEDNNVLRSNPIFVTAPPAVDLEITSINNLQDTLISGTTQTVSWAVENNGSSTSLWNYNIWYDGMFLSSDTIWDSNDQFLKDWSVNGPLDNNQSYSKYGDFEIPIDVAGDYYFLLVTDHQNLINDGDTTNNKIVVSNILDTGLVKIPIHIQPSPSPNLLADTVFNQLQGVIDQPVTVHWTVSNIGNEDVTTNWTDKIYLSTDFNVDFSDIIVGTVSRSNILPSGSSYSDSLDILLSVPNPGNYILLVKTDANNSIVELNGENNNVSFSFVAIAQSPPADLIVSSLNSNPSIGMVGKLMDFNWIIKNQGLFPANGIMKDILYFSLDSIFDISDTQIGIFETNSVFLPPLGEDTRTASFQVPGLQFGDYHLILSTDALNNINEVSDTNNVYISPNKITITVEELPIGFVSYDTLYNEQNLFYRIEVPDSLSGESLLVTLKGDSLNGINELYLSHESIPSRSTHDFSHTSPFQSDQQIVIPNLQIGTYYLLSYGLSSNGTYQEIELHPQIIDFDIFSIQSDFGGNTGNVTVKINGAKFEPSMELRLEDSSLGTIIANNINFVNATTIFATFPLAGASTGKYDVIAENQNNEIATLPQSFEVILGDIGTVSGGSASSGFTCSIVNIGFGNQLAQNIQHPTGVRLNRVIPITIQFGNSGNVNIPVPTRFLISLRGAPLAMIPEDLINNDQELFLEFKEIDGPEDVLRPGISSSLTVYTYSSHALRFILKE